MKWGKYAGPARVAFEGDVVEAQKYVGLAKAQMGRMLAFAESLGLRQQVWRRTYPVYDVYIETIFVAPHVHNMVIRAGTASSEDKKLYGHGFTYDLWTGNGVEIFDLVEKNKKFTYERLTLADNYRGKYPVPFQRTDARIQWIGTDDVLYGVSSGIYRVGALWSPLLTGYSLVCVSKYQPVADGPVRVFAACKKTGVLYVFSRPFTEDGYETATVYDADTDPTGWRLDATEASPTAGGELTYSANTTGNAMVTFSVFSDRLDMLDINIDVSFSVSISKSSVSHSLGATLDPITDYYIWWGTPGGERTWVHDHHVETDFECNDPAGTPFTAHVGWEYTVYPPSIPYPTCQESDLTVKNMKQIYAAHTLNTTLTYNKPSSSWGQTKYLAALYVGNTREVVRHETAFSFTHTASGSRAADWETDVEIPAPGATVTYGSMASTYSNTGTLSLVSYVHVGSSYSFPVWDQRQALNNGHSCSGGESPLIRTGVKNVYMNQFPFRVMTSCYLDIRNNVVVYSTKEIQTYASTAPKYVSSTTTAYDLLKGKVVYSNVSPEDEFVGGDILVEDGAWNIYSYEDSLLGCSFSTALTLTSGTDTVQLSDQFRIPATIFNPSVVQDWPLVSRSIGGRLFLSIGDDPYLTDGNAYALSGGSPPDTFHAIRGF